MEVSYGDIIREYRLRLKKRLGQHFMTDPRLLDAIASCAVPDETWVVLEIGAGIGTLTRVLCQKAHWVYALELDTSLKEPAEAVCRGLPNLTWIWGDALEYDLSGKKLAEDHPGHPLLVCGNLPYYVTSEVLYRTLIPRVLFRRMFYLVQEEVGERMRARPGTRDFGRLSLWCQYRAHVTLLKRIPKGAFVPPPEVVSCLVRLDMRPSFPLTPQEEKILDQISRAAFSKRRKTIANSLKDVFGPFKEEDSSLPSLPHFLQKVNLDPRKRAEDLSVDDYVLLAKALSERGAQV